MKKRVFNDDEFNDEPLSDRELYLMLRENFDTNEQCWEIVKESQEAFWDLNRHLVLMEMEDEKNDIDPYEQYAA